MKNLFVKCIISRKNIFHILAFTLFVFLTFGFMSCESAPAFGSKSKSNSAASSDVQQDQIPRKSLQINYVDTVTFSLKPDEAKLLQNPKENEYIMELPLPGNILYRQIWDDDSLDYLSDAVSRYVLDEKQKRLGNIDTRSFNAYGTIDGRLEWFDNSTKQTLSVEPRIDLGYLITDGNAHFLMTLRDTAVPDVTGLRSSRVTFCMAIEQVREMMEIFNCKFIEKPLLVFLGENLTAGFNVNNDSEEDRSRAYPAVLQEMLKINILNSSVCWISTAETLSRVEDNVMRYDPDIVVINLGYRDFTERVDPIETTRNLQEIINIFKQGERKIYLTRFYDDFILQSTMNYWELTERQQTALLTSYETMFRNLSRTNGIELITGIWDGLAYDDTIGEDYLNPTAEGQRIMAGNFFRFMRPYLEANNFLK